MKKFSLIIIILLLVTSCSSKSDTTPVSETYADGTVVVLEEPSVSEDVYEIVKGEYMTLDQDKAYEMMNNEDVIVLDVRTQEEYSEGHIANANLLPVDVLANQIEEKFPDKSAVYLVYCRSGNRSRTASNAMVELGYTVVYDIGGINTWQYEIVND